MFRAKSIVERDEVENKWIFRFVHIFSSFSSFLLTIFSPRLRTRQCRYTSFPNCVVSLTCVCSSSKIGYGSWWVVVFSTSSSKSSSRSSASGDMCQNLGISKPKAWDVFGTETSKEAKMNGKSVDPSNSTQFANKSLSLLTVRNDR